MLSNDLVFFTCLLQVFMNFLFSSLILFSNVFFISAINSSPFYSSFCLLFDKELSFRPDILDETLKFSGLFLFELILTYSKKKLQTYNFFVNLNLYYSLNFTHFNNFKKTAHRIEETYNKINQ